MKSAKKRVWGCSLLLLGLTACVGGQPAVQRRDLVIDVRGADSARISGVAVFEGAGGTFVAGRLRQLHEFKLPGHVDVRVCEPDGSTELVQGKVGSYASRRGGVREATFRAHLRSTPPQGASLLVRYHLPGDASEHGLRCDS